MGEMFRVRILDDDVLAGKSLFRQGLIAQDEVAVVLERKSAPVNLGHGPVIVPVCLIMLKCGERVQVMATINDFLGTDKT